MEKGNKKLIKKNQLSFPSGMSLEDVTNPPATVDLCKFPEKKVNKILSKCFSVKCDFCIALYVLYNAFLASHYFISTPWFLAA